jgi:hypothetical protein
LAHCPSDLTTDHNEWRVCEDVTDFGRGSV